MTKIKEFIKNLNDKYKIGFLRWWFAAAVCFFISWGTGFGMQASTLDLIVFLGVGMGVATLFIFNPLVFSIFDLKRRGKIVNKKMSERTILEGIFYFLSEMIKCMLSVYIVSWIYQGINMLINYIGDYPASTVKFGLEPILFGIFYLVIYTILGMIWYLIETLYLKIFRKGVFDEEVIDR